MPNSIKSQIDSLVKLQSIEVEVDGIKSMLKEAPGKIAALDDELKATEEDLSLVGGHVEALKKKYREQEAEVQLCLTRMKKSQAKLSTVKNNREYQAILKEIDDLKTKNSDIEDEMLMELDQIDATEQALAEKTESYASLSDEISSEKTHMQQHTREERERLSGLEADRDAMTRVIESELLDTFSAIKRKHGGGMAIVSVSDSVCSGCNVNLPPQMYNELQRVDSLKLCPNCQRIIYWDQS